MKNIKLRTKKKPRELYTVRVPLDQTFRKGAVRFHFTETATDFPPATPNCPKCGSSGSKYRFIAATDTEAEHIARKCRSCKFARKQPCCDAKPKQESAWTEPDPDPVSTRTNPLPLYTPKPIIPAVVGPVATPKCPKCHNTSTVSFTDRHNGKWRCASCDILFFQMKVPGYPDEKGPWSWYGDNGKAGLPGGLTPTIETEKPGRW